MEERQVFVAYPYNISRDDYRGVFEEVGAEHEVQFVYADEEITNKQILHKIAGMIEEAEFSLFDITGWNPNVALELGVAVGGDFDYYILFNPSVDDQGDVPADLGGIDRIQYEDYAPLRHGLAKLMTQQFGPSEEDPAVEAGAFANQLEALTETVPTVVSNEPGMQIGGVASALGVPIEIAQILVRPLLADETLVTRGKKRGTRYYLPQDAPEPDDDDEGEEWGS